jgi:Zn-dependent protease with chaperone function
MPIRVVCSSCSCAFKVADAAAGKSGRCPKCQAALTIPQLRDEPSIDLVPLDEDEAPVLLEATVSRSGGKSGASSPKRKKPAPVALGDEDLITTATLTARQILSAFQEYIEPVKPTGMYRLWIALVAGFMMVLPILYLGVIGLVGYAIYYHLVNHTGLVDFLPGGSRHVNAFMFMLYWAPAVAGLALIAFLLKPLFARSGGSGEARSLDPSKEPLLFAFVDGVCSTVGARTPARIDVDCQVNASASFLGGPFSLFNRDLVLTIGLPLVGGLSLKQFAGVLAHEFGHFSQGTGMRLSVMIRSINMWFGRVVYERDSWDEKIDQMCTSDGNISIFGWIFKGAVWLSRRVLWVFMMAGHIVSGFLLRQMEFDADRYEARMVGGDVFESTARKLQVLGAATQGAFIDLRNSWRDGSLVDNLPKLITANVVQIPKPVLAKIQQGVTEGKTGLFDTHPCDRDRIFQAHAEDVDGVFALDGPATDVFRDFDSLCRAATYDHYKGIFGPNGVDKESLKPVGDVVRTQTAAMKGNEALFRFYQGVFNPFRPFLLPDVAPTAPDDAKKAKAGLVSARERMAATIENYEELLKKHEALQGEAIKVAAARAMLKAGFKFKTAEFGVTKATIECAEEAAGEITTDLEKLDEQLSIRESATIRRIHAALSLLENENIFELVQDAATWRDESREVYSIARHVGRIVIPALAAALKGHQALIAVLSKWPGNEQNPKMHDAALRAGKTLSGSLARLRDALGDEITYPFEHREGAITLAQYALPEIPDAKDINGLLNVGGEVIDKTIPMHYRLVGRLMLAAEAVETALGLEPLPERLKNDDLMTDGA